MSFKDWGLNFGSFKDKPTNLKFYPGLDLIEKEVKDLCTRSGYKILPTQRHAAVNFKSTSFKTGFLVIQMYLGNKFDDAKYKRVHQTLFTLAQALTLKEVNYLFGEGKLAGTIKSRGAHGTKRAIYWCWSSVNKMRDLIRTELDFELDDEAFFHESNTVMAELSYRLVMAMSPDTTEYGFWPKDGRVELPEICAMCKV